MKWLTMNQVDPDEHQLQAEVAPTAAATAAPPVRRLRVARNLFAGILLFLIIEAAIFQSGFYDSYLEPNSYAGKVRSGVNGALVQQTSGKRQILLLGDSRMDEGFSSKVADEPYRREDLSFCKLAIAGSSLRTQYYLAREADPSASSYAAVVIGVTDYDDLHTSENMADRALDLRFTTPLLGYRDLLEYSWSFPSLKNRTDAVLNCALKGHAYKQDLQDFLANPSGRLRAVQKFQENRRKWIYNYEGSSESLAGLEYDQERGKLRYPPDLTPKQRDDLASIIRQSKGKPYPNTAYRRKWLVEVVRRYADTLTRVVFVQMPRGPFVPIRKHQERTESIAEMANLPNVTVLDAHLFDFLERPEYFQDHLHLNATGRQLFSEELGAILAASVGVSPAQDSANSDNHRDSLWIEADEGLWLLKLHKSYASAASSGFHKQQNLCYVKPKFWFDLPKSREEGAVTISGNIQSTHAALLPITVVASAPPGWEGHYHCDRQARLV